MAIKEWSDGLRGLSGQDIKRGLSNLSSEWPPSLPQFKAACIVKKDWQHAAHKEFALLPKPKINKEQAKENIAALKAAIHKGRK